MCAAQSSTNPNLNDSADIQMQVIPSTIVSTPIRPCRAIAYDKRKITQSVEVKKEMAFKEVSKKTTRNIKFSQKEDKELLKGIQKHGEKSWASIIKDESLEFHPSRTRDSLRVRADSAAFKKLLNNRN